MGVVYMKIGMLVSDLLLGSEACSMREFELRMVLVGERADAAFVHLR